MKLLVTITVLLFFCVYCSISAAASQPAASQLPNSVATVARTTGTSFIPTSVIRNMAGQRTADDKLSKDGTYFSNAISIFGEEEPYTVSLYL